MGARSLASSRLPILLDAYLLLVMMLLKLPSHDSLLYSSKVVREIGA